MSFPLKWAVGDKCIARGQRGVVDSVGEACACVALTDEEAPCRLMFCGLEELSLVPLDSVPPLSLQEELDELEVTPIRSIPPEITALASGPPCPAPHLSQCGKDPPEYNYLAWQIVEWSSAYNMPAALRAELERNIRTELRAAFVAGKQHALKVAADLDEEYEEIEVDEVA